jgi:hypothetical protein
MANAVAEVFVIGVMVWFLLELGMSHYFGRAGMPTHGNRVAHWFYDRRK